MRRPVNDERINAKKWDRKQRLIEGYTKAKEMDPVGIEPTTFHKYTEYAKRKSYP